MSSGALNKRYLLQVCMAPDGGITLDLLLAALEEEWPDAAIIRNRVEITTARWARSSKEAADLAWAEAVRVAKSNGAIVSDEWRVEVLEGEPLRRVYSGWIGP